MRKVPKAIIPLIELVSRSDTTVDHLLAMLAKEDSARLKRNSFHLIQAVPNFEKSINRLKFAAVHYACGSSSSVFAMLANECIRCEMTDEEACDVVVPMLQRKWLEPYPGLLFHTCLHGKRKLAEALYAEGVRITNSDWGLFLEERKDGAVVPMAQLYIKIASPHLEELLAMRLASIEDSPLISYLDNQLSLIVPPQATSLKH